MWRGLIIVGALLCAGCKRDSHWMKGLIEREFAVHTGVGETIRVQSVDQGRYVSVEGVWTIDGSDRIAAPINVSRITCIQDEDAYCEVHRAEVLTIGGRPTLMMDSDIYDVRSWEDGEITAVTDAQCRTVTLRVSERENTVTVLTTGTADCADPLGVPLAQPRLARLISGAELDAMRRRGDEL